VSRPRKHRDRRRWEDVYTRQARADRYRARSVYKLAEIDRRDDIFRGVGTVVDIGASPGGWSQYAGEMLGPQARIIAVDRLPMKPIDRVEFIQGDFTEETVAAACKKALGGVPADLVLSDIAPNLSGVRVMDQARSLELAGAVLVFAGEVLRDGGDLLIKLFQGDGAERHRKELTQLFQKVMVRKPQASRNESREFYVLARGYRL